VYGLNDIKITSIDGLTQVDLPESVTLSFKERVKSAEAMGDDRIGGVVAVLEAVDWELEYSSLPLEALAVIYGTTTGTTGTTPNQVKTLARSGATRLPYFKIYGKSLGEGDDDVHCLLFKCKVTGGQEVDLKYGEIAKPKIKGIGIDDGSNGVYKWVQNETADTLPGS
jgi:hypothetical protein